ncbi:MAG: transcriptional repressor LexA [bacterium]
MYDKYKEKIIGFYKKNKRMPTYSEIMKLVGFKSKNAVSRLIIKMMDQGLISKDQRGRLIPEKFFNSIRVLGMVEAGFPSPAEEELSDTMSLDQYLIDNKEATFMLRVNGDSMKDAGIIHGDMVLVERNKTPYNGDIVIAEIDNNWTMKYFRKKGEKVYLEAANEKYNNLFPQDELKIEAVVKAVIRKY